MVLERGEEDGNHGVLDDDADGENKLGNGAGDGAGAGEMLGEGADAKVREALKSMAPGAQGNGSAAPAASRRLAMLWLRPRYKLKAPVVSSGPGPTPPQNA